MSNELKRCPFCGGKAQEATLAVDYNDFAPYIMCEDCDAGMLGTVYDNDLKDPYSRLRIEWNRRVDNVRP